VSIWLSIVLISLCAVCWDAGVVLQKQAADGLPPLASAKALKRFVTSPRWMLGLGLSAGGWGLFAWALEGTPVSLARAIQGSGLVILAFFSVLFLDHRLKGTEWVSVLAVTAGVLALGFSEPAEAPTATVLVPGTLGAGIGGALGLCLLSFLFFPRLAALFGAAPVTSAIAGVLLGLGDVLTKALLVAVDGGKLGLAFGVLGPALATVYLGGFFVLSRGYQHGRALVVTAISDTASRLVSLVLGVGAMGEAFPQGAADRALRVGGLALVIVGTIFLARFTGEQLAHRMGERG
jgi:multidrug transporter EmrE-like cation transporter